ncbi:hypothetical protein HPB50_020770 [Hyalomma asiaticum]|uniref:Uncharacterized protein n=1 Tax=Hyalomma asiaticum TaxID=266040 RepID=A0ACB7RMZ0_HYAAI|nr:hypothetical protein HPB50_020770 [Hyalomma asiaticum]
MYRNDYAYTRLFISGLHENRNLSGSSKVAPWVRDVLRRNLSLEYELYDFVRQRLHAQWRRLHT